MAVLTISIDLTKMNSKSTVWVGTEKSKLRKRIKRSLMPVFFANMSSCRIGMEVCAGARHY